MHAQKPHGIPVSSVVTSEDPRQRLIVALDVSTAAAARKIVMALGDTALTYKVGMQLYTAEGPQVVRDLVASGRRVFLDLKYHDIPNTVGGAVREAAQLGVSMLTVHAAGGGKMLRAGVEAARSNPQLMVLAVTVLTSMEEHAARLWTACCAWLRSPWLRAVMESSPPPVKSRRCAPSSGTISPSSSRASAQPAADMAIRSASLLPPKPSPPAPAISLWEGPSPKPQILSPRHAQSWDRSVSRRAREKPSRLERRKT